MLLDPFDVATGVRKGCILSPVLFILIFVKVMRMAIIGGNSVQCNSFKHIYLIGRKMDAPQGNNTALNVGAKVPGLKFSIAETKFMKGG